MVSSDKIRAAVNLARAPEEHDPNVITDPRAFDAALARDEHLVARAIEILTDQGAIPMAGLEADVAMWQRKTFPDATPQSILAHLKEEVDELASAIGNPLTTQRDGPQECADIGLLLVALTWQYGTTLALEMHRKHAINKDRTFTYRPELGYSKAVHEGAETDV